MVPAIRRWAVVGTRKRTVGGRENKKETTTFIHIWQAESQACERHARQEAHPVGEGNPEMERRATNNDGAMKLTPR